MPFAIHHDATRTTSLLKRTVFWPGMVEDVKTFVRSCLECRLVKGRVSHPELQVRQIEAEPFMSIAIDHAGPFPRTKRGKTHILVIIDMFSGYPEAIPVGDIRAVSTASALIQHFGRFGWPKVILSDNGTSFKNDVFKILSQRTRVKQRFITARHP